MIKKNDMDFIVLAEPIQNEIRVININSCHILEGPEYLGKCMVVVL